MFHTLRLRPIALALATAATLATAPAVSAQSSSPAPTSPAPVVFGSKLGNYWQGFVEFWVGSVKKQNGVVLVAAGVGIVSVFIITRGKWKK